MTNVKIFKIVSGFYDSFENYVTTPIKSLINFVV